jgi:hypothetical protein
LPSEVRCKGAAANQIHYTDQRATGRGSFEVDDFIIVARTEVDCLANFFVQILHEGKGNFAHIDARFNNAAEFEQTNAKAIGAGVLAFDKACGSHGRQNSMRG